MNEVASLSSTVRAGRLLRLLGWITLALTLILGAAIATPTFTNGDQFPQNAVFALMGAVAVVVVYLVVGSGVKKYQPWAKVGGIAIALLSLANVPIGTIIGALILYHLVRGWREQPRVA
jgi:hypothetical protein